MAEYLDNNVKPDRFDYGPDEGFNAFGKPVPFFRRQNAVRHLKDMGLTDAEDCFTCVNGMAEQIGRDQPHEAFTIGMRYIDLTGCYRIVAVLCTGKDPAIVAQRQANAATIADKRKIRALRGKLRKTKKSIERLRQPYPFITRRRIGK
jgi:hypothetical protein